MAGEEMILTQEGWDELERELEELKTVKRRELAARIKTAISYGDLKENSEYHSAKNDQSFMEGRILTIEHILRKAKIAEKMDDSRVHVGSIAVLNDIEFAETIEYRIVGPSEANVSENKISYSSPLGVALMNRTVGDIIHVEAPMGIIKYELLAIKQ